MDLLIIAVIAFAGSLLSGFLGLGGAVILIPAYLYIPQLLGAAPLTVAHVSGITSLQILASSIAGMTVHRSRGMVNRSLVVAMGIPIAAASFAGAYLSKNISPQIILSLFGGMAIFSAMILIVKRPDAEQTSEIRFSPFAAVVIAFVVGLLGGIVGAAGAFLLAPLMMIALKIPVRVTIGSTLGIVILSAAAASAGKLITGQVPVVETIAAIAGAVPGVIAGSIMSHRTQPAVLRIVLAMLIAAVGIGMMMNG